MQPTTITRLAKDAKRDGLTLGWAMPHLAEKLEQTEQALLGPVRAIHAAATQMHKYYA